jgi:AraC-like DNA-binding protein
MYAADCKRRDDACKNMQYKDKGAPVEKRRETQQMTITVHLPSPPLNAYINYLWYCDGPTPYPRLKILPMPSLHLMVNFGDAYNVYGTDQAGPLAMCAESWSVGLWNTYHLMDRPPNMQLINVSFKLGEAYPFFQLPLSELHNSIVPLDAIWGHSAARIREQVYAAPTHQARFAVLERLLLARLREAPYGLATVRFAIATLCQQRTAQSIQSLSDHMGISQKHLITQFKRLVGGTPKEVARIYRLKHVLYSIDPTQSIDWTQVAYQYGYYDQAHFDKDFHAFTGDTPTNYLRLLRRVQTEQPNLAQHPQHVPTG